MRLRTGEFRRFSNVHLALVFLATTPLVVAADPQAVALALKAQTGFDRVEMSPAPPLTELLACVQSQAAVLPVSRPAEHSTILYRKGYCTLLSGATTRNRSDFTAAAQAFQESLRAWPERLGRQKDLAFQTEPVSSAIRVLNAVSLLEAGPDIADLPRIEAELTSAVELPACASNVTSPGKCNEILGLGHMWLGWIEYRRNALLDAVRNFAAVPHTGWYAWATGKQAAEARLRATAIPAMQRAIASWRTEQQAPKAGLIAMLAPEPDIPQALQDLGVQLYVNGDDQAALAAFDSSLKARPNNAYTLYLRARTRDRLGLTQQALADYNMAGRTALAGIGDADTSAAAHLYRGIWMFRQRRFDAAEEEFASALNLDPGPLRPDVIAWRHMAVVASADCEKSGPLLEAALADASPLFPKSEAEALLAQCRRKSISRASR